MIRPIGVLAVALSLLSAAAWAEEHPTFQDLWSAATQKPDCTPADFADFILVTCKSELTLWYFTKPNHPAHPGVVKRTITLQNGDWEAREEGSSFGSDEAQPAFKAWLAQIGDLDRRMKEALGRAHGAPQSQPSDQ
jgi:hypothetical protein